MANVINPIPLMAEQMKRNPFYNPLQPGPDIAGGINAMEQRYRTRGLEDQSMELAERGVAVDEQKAASDEKYKTAYAEYLTVQGGKPGRAASGAEIRMKISDAFVGLEIWTPEQGMLYAGSSVVPDVDYDMTPGMANEMSELMGGTATPSDIMAWDTEQRNEAIKTLLKDLPSHELNTREKIATELRAKQQKEEEKLADKKEDEEQREAVLHVVGNEWSPIEIEMYRQSGNAPSGAWHVSDNIMARISEVHPLSLQELLSLPQVTRREIFDDYSNKTIAELSELRVHKETEEMDSERPLFTSKQRADEYDDSHSKVIREFRDRGIVGKGFTWKHANQFMANTGMDPVMGAYYNTLIDLYTKEPAQGSLLTDSQLMVVRKAIATQQWFTDYRNVSEKKTTYEDWKKDALPSELELDQKLIQDYFTVYGPNSRVNELPTLKKNIFKAILSGLTGIGGE